MVPSFSLNTLNISQCRDPVVHKICIRKLNGYLFILKNIVSEKWSSEKSSSGQHSFPILLNFSNYIVKCFQHRLPKIHKFQHELTVKIMV